MQRILRAIPFGLVIFFAVGVSLYALSYLFIHHGFLNTKGMLTIRLSWTIGFYMHFIGGAVALSIGWIQFWRKFRNSNLAIHRLLGKIYVASILLVGGPGGLYIAFYANGGFANQLGFGCLAIAWLYTTMKALSAIRKKDIKSHLKWMVRSYAVTFAAPALRVWMPFFIAGLGVSESEAYAAVAWFCWVPNLVIAEWVISKNMVQA